MGVWLGLREIYAHASPRRRREFAALLGLMFVGAVAELGTIGSLIPFLALLVHGTAGHLPWPVNALVPLGHDAPAGAIVVTAIVFGVFAILSGLVRLELAWLTQHFVNRLGHELALETQRRILSQPYSFHILQNSSTLVTATDKAEILVFELVLPLMQSMTAGFIAFIIVLGLLYIDPVTTLVALAAFSAIYLLITAVTAKRLAENSDQVATAYEERLKVLQEGLGGIRDIIIDGAQSVHLRLFDRVNSRLGRARATTTFIAVAPRYIVEALGMVVIAAVAVFIAGRAGGIALILPVLGAFALGAQRLLPLVQTVYTGWSVAAGHRSIVGQVIEILRLPVPQAPSAIPQLPFHESISVEDVRFFYPSRPNAATLSAISLGIPKGAMVALTGRTGSGKSTLADLLMALLQPVEGKICIDGVPLTPANARAWQQNIAHVPQSIFLADTTIAKNIALAFGDEPLDLQRIVSAAKQAQLHEFVETLPQGYETIVGERGIRLSGGQRQRLGLARVIYKEAPVLVLDEATSALDYETEAAVIGALEQLRREGRTIIIIAHRRSTIRHCDLVARLEHGRLVEFGPLPDAVAAQQRLS